MYKVYTPSGPIETDYKSALVYQRNGYVIERIPDEFTPESVFGEETDAMGNCFSDADNGL